ncbi:Enteropeptidase [Habropoda laboriosa]|uniref:Enteropeptidase n=1 Tax=Habropoda laboriosa TaxID=597456 RepID=A0A0L7R3U7_9HYME|nr:Enteropeptidase [Habropoda laboriosa]
MASMCGSSKSYPAINTGSYYRPSGYPYQNDYYLPPRSTWSRVSPQQTKQHRGSTTWKVGSAMLIVSAMLVLIAVFAIAGLALWMGALRTDSKNAIVGFSCSFRVAKGEKYNPMLKLNTSMVFREKERKYKNIFELLFRRSVISTAYKQTIIDKFENGILKVFFRIYLDRRKIPRSITNVEDTIKDIIAKETYSSSSLFKDMELDLTSVSVKRINQEVPGSQKQTQQKNAMITKNGLLRPTRNNSLITSSKAKSKPTKIESTEPDIDFSNIPTIQGTYKATHVNLTSTKNQTSTQDPMKVQSNARNTTKVSLSPEKTTSKLASIEDTTEASQSSTQTTAKIKEQVHYTVHNESFNDTAAETVRNVTATSTSPTTQTKDEDLFKDFHKPDFETSPWKPIIPEYVNTELKLLPDNVGKATKVNYKVNTTDVNLRDVVLSTTAKTPQENDETKVPEPSTPRTKLPEPPELLNTYMDVPGMSTFDIGDSDFPRDRIVPQEMVNFRVNGKFKNKIPGLLEDGQIFTEPTPSKFDDDERPEIEVAGQLPSETYDIKLRTSAQPERTEFSFTRPDRFANENETDWRTPSSQMYTITDTVGVAEPVSDMDAELEARNRYSDTQAIGKHRNNALQDRKVDKNTQEPVYTSYKTPDLNGAGIRPSLIESSGTLKPFRHTIPVDKIASVVSYNKNEKENLSSEESSQERNATEEEAVKVFPVNLKEVVTLETIKHEDGNTEASARIEMSEHTEPTKSSTAESIIDDDKFLKLSTTEVYSEMIHPLYNNVDKLVVKNEGTKEAPPRRMTMNISRNSTFIEIDTLKHTPGEVEEDFSSSRNKSSSNKTEDNWFFNGTIYRPFTSPETRKKIYNDTLKAYVVENLVTLAPAKSNTGVGRPIRPRPKLDREKTMRIDQKSSNRSSSDDATLLEQLFGVYNNNRKPTKRDSFNHEDPIETEAKGKENSNTGHARFEQIVEVVTSISTKVSSNFKEDPVVLKFVVTNSTSLPVIHLQSHEEGTSTPPTSAPEGISTGSKEENRSFRDQNLKKEAITVISNVKSDDHRPLTDFEKLKEIADIATGNETLMNSSAGFTLTRDGMEIFTKILNKIEDRTDKMISTTEDNLETDRCFGFLCRDGKCLPSSGRCNMLGECPNSEDEANCTCADFLRAQLLHQKICDGVADCWDYSDETDCDWCEEGQFVCGNSRTCIDQRKVCNGYTDCPGGEDEKKCAALIDDGIALYPSPEGHFSEIESTTNKDILYDQEAVESSIFESTTLHELKDTIQLEKLISTKDEPAIKEGSFLDSRENSNATTLVSGREISSNGKDTLAHGNSIHVNPKNDTTSIISITKEINNYNERGYLNIRKNGKWGKLCLSGMDNLLQERQAVWTFFYLQNFFFMVYSTTKLYSDYDTVEKVLDDSPTSVRSYYTLSYNEKSLDKTILTFKPSECPSGEILRVKCKNFECGIRTQAPSQARIVGGGSSSAGSWPWQVALYKEGDYQCGGALINERWILSAAHCFYHAQNEYWVARIGATRRGSFPSPYEQVLRLDHISLHPDYIDNGFINDIAMLRLEEPVTFSDYVRPVCLPQSEPKSGTTCTVTGWGQLFEIGRIFPDTLQEVQLPVISTEECRRKTLFLPLYRITSGMLCAGLKDGGRDACLGDSGGPLVCSGSDNKYTLHGITSNGYGCARPGRPGVYTKVHYYLFWVKYVISRQDIPSSIASCKGHRCPLGECLPKSRICNGFLECSDGSDERNCPVNL